MMTQITPEALANVPSLDDLYEKLAPLSIGAGWNKPTPSLWPEPKSIFQPAHWSYGQAKGALDAAGRLIDTAQAERRNLILANPFEGNTYATTRTIVAAYQMIMPDEKARSHRHTPNALRLIIDTKPGVYSIVNGTQIEMLPGDVVLTPNWCWHGHRNDSGARAYWLDFLDAPLVQLLDPMFFEPYPGEFEEATNVAGNSPMCFRAADTVMRLKDSEQTPEAHYATQVELGDPALDTMGLHMISLAANRQTTPFRTTANNIYSVVSGTGSSTIGDKTFAWGPGDVLAAPAWATHSHKATTDAIVFRVTDEPMLQRLGFFR
ncbi:MAG TPA: cupin domain-containing protein [Devosiaceae bacterium]|jgi:gentisate 1,2-dioxygenase